MLGKMLVPLSAIGRVSYPEFFNNEDGKQSFLCGYYCISNTIGFGVEMDDCCEYARFFKYVDKNEEVS